MEIKDLTAILVVAMVGCVLVAGFIPVVGESVSATTTFENEGLINLNKVDSTYEETIIWDYTKPTKLTIGTDEIDLPTNAPFALTFMTNADFFARYYYSVANSFIQVYKTGTSSAYQASVTNNQTMTITISNNNIVFDNGSGNTSTVAGFDEMYCICAGKGGYVMKAPSTTAYLKDDSDIFAYGQTYIAGVTFNTIISGTPADGFERIVWPDTIPMTYTDMQDDLTLEAGYIGLNTLKEFKYTVTNTNTGVSATVTYGQFIVPSTVTAEKAIHADANTASIVSMIPFILIMGIVLMFVGVVLVRRYV